MKYTLSGLTILINKISNKLKTGNVIYLKGDLGTGKTTIAKILIQNLFKKYKKKKAHSYKPYIQYRSILSGKQTDDYCSLRFISIKKK